MSALTLTSPSNQPIKVYPSLVTAVIVVSLPTTVAPSTPLTEPADGLFAEIFVLQRTHLASSVTSVRPSVKSYSVLPASLTLFSPSNQPTKVYPSFGYAFIPSFGNAIAVESKEKVNSFFKLYDFLTNWICGVAAICLFTLLTPLIHVWVGEKYSVPISVVACLALNFYMFGMRMCPNHVSNAAGLFAPNKYVSFIQGAVNLVISILLGKVLGVLGVFIGTIVSGLVPSIWRPITIFKYYFKSSSKQYFTNYLGNLLLVVSLAVIFGVPIQSFHLIHNWFTLIVFAIVVFVVTNFIFILVYRKKPEYVELKGRLYALLSSLKKRLQRGRNDK